jgi:radical SAM superfamily enzyme YgiQ (UPF0313 family)
MGKKLVDLNVDKLEQDDIDWADIVFVSGMLIQKESAKEIIRHSKESGKIVVAGGPAFNAETDSFPEVDHFVLDEAEITLPLFLNDLATGKLQKIYTSDERPDITNTPIPMWSLINMKKYAAMSIQYSRGCPFDCEFCDIILLNGRIPRTKTPDQMTAELQALYDAGWRGGVFIVDDNFIGNKKKVKEMLPHIVEWQRKNNYPFTLFTEASVDLGADFELMGLMSNANFNKVFLGIETPNPESLVECGKNQNTRFDIAECVQNIQQHGMQVMGGFIVGFDNDTEDIFESQVKFIQNMGIFTAMVGILEAVPNTKLWKRLKAEGRLLTEGTGNNTDTHLNFIPKMGKNNLIEGYKWIVKKIYSPHYYYDRINTFVKNFNPTAKAKFSLADFEALVRSIWRIGIFSRSSILYWKLIIKTFFVKFKALPSVIELAILGVHFQYITKKITQTRT